MITAKQQARHAQARHAPIGRRLRTSSRLKELQIFVNLCFALIAEEDYKEICNRTGLHLSTIYRLAKGEASAKTHIDTVQRMANAAGLWLDVSDMSVRLAE